MSSVDPRWPPPGGHPGGWPPPAPPSGPVRSRRPAWVYLLAVVVPLALVAALLLPLGVAAVWRRVASGTTAPAQNGRSVVDGSRGLGDPYYPVAGNGGHAVPPHPIRGRRGPPHQPPARAAT